MAKKKKKQEPLIHIKLNYDEAIRTKKDILFLQLYLVKLQRALQKYKILRIKELRMQQRLKARLNNSKKDLTKLNIALPHPELPKILKHEEKEEEIKEFENVVEEKYDDSLEQELRDIQARLKSIGNK